MPPISPQGSRGGLIAAVVIFVMLFVITTILAINFGVQGNKATEDYASLYQKMSKIAVDTTSADVDALIRQSQADNSLPEKTALAEAVRQRNELRKIIVGTQSPSSQPSDVATTNDLADTMNRATDALNQAAAVLAAGGQKPAPDSLVQSVAALVTQMQAVSQQVGLARTDRDKARAEADAESQAAKDAQAKTQQVLAQNTTELKEKLDAANDAIKKYQDDLEAAKKVFTDEQTVSASRADASDQERARLTKTIEDQKQDIHTLQLRLNTHRVSVVDPIIRRHEAEIIRVADASTVYINLGKGDQVMEGLTFEVYDKTQPLPKLGNGTADEDMPVGKGSIEVVRVLADSCECHVNKLEPGQHFVEGDPILNIVYDRNIKYHFYVYGNFDVAEAGRLSEEQADKLQRSIPAADQERRSAAQADIIKRLITEWGGQVDNKLTPDADFVIMGNAPYVPTFTKDELNDANNQLALATAKEAYDRYENVLDLAAKYGVPIMNQNRFLYFTGYYDVAQR